MTDDNRVAARNRATVERFLAGTHSPDLAEVAVIDETVAPGIVCHGFPGGDPYDRESYKAFFRTFRRAFADMSFEIDALVANRQFVSARWHITCVHAEDFAGVAGTGRTVAFDGLVLYRMENGLIAETWLRADEMAILGQIGALPAIAA